MQIFVQVPFIGLAGACVNLIGSNGLVSGTTFEVPCGFVSKGSGRGEPKTRAVSMWFVLEELPKGSPNDARVQSGWSGRDAHGSDLPKTQKHVVDVFF